jgi:hypothetical protein
MGWGISVAVRNEVIGPGLQYAVALPDVSVLLVDGPAMTRSGAVGTRPATTIVRSIINTAPATVTEIVVLFDCPTKIPAARAAVHVRRAAASQTVFAPEALRLMTATSLNGATWQELFSTAAGKARAYNLLFDAFKVETIAASATATTDVRTTLTDPETNAVWSHPYDGTRSAMADDIELYDYGEAECQLAMCIRGLAARSPEIRAAVLTIDTDIYLQTALSPVIDTSQIVIAAARVWRNDTTVVRVASAGRKRARAEQLTQMWELVTCDALLPAATPAGLFLHLCAGGVDYCKGLGGYGWPQSNLVAAVAKAAGNPPFTEAESGWSLDVKALATALKPARKTTRRETDIGQLCIELDNIVYCWRYYMWQDARRPNVAGPVMESIFATHDAKTITQWLDVARGTIALVDSCPVEPPTA